MGNDSRFAIVVGPALERKRHRSPKYPGDLEIIRQAKSIKSSFPHRSLNDIITGLVIKDDPSPEIYIIDTVSRIRKKIDKGK